MLHAPKPLLWSPTASAAAAMSPQRPERHPASGLQSPQIDRSALKVGFRSARTLLAPPRKNSMATAAPAVEPSFLLCMFFIFAHVVWRLEFGTA